MKKDKFLKRHALEEHRSVSQIVEFAVKQYLSKRTIASGGIVTSKLKAGAFISVQNLTEMYPSEILFKNIEGLKIINPF
ncbi:MAG: hypothetical protein J7K04_10445 [Spirochaetales bacterium]|nr:hypothetical protein [Spirochaetales bacterium]